jgi:CubicO group peptidase (beta-lactamase class C family)
MAQLLSETIWQKIGAEEDTLFAVDSVGTATAGGGLATTLRDFARVGEMFRLDGRYNGQQIVPKTVIDDIRKGGDKEHFAKAGYTTLPGWSYRDMWWISHNEHGAYTMRGIHGQALWIDPKAEMVIARFASNPVAANPANDPISLPAYMELAKYLMKSD